MSRATKRSSFVQSRVWVWAAAVVVAMLFDAGGARAEPATGPVKLVLSSRFGWKVNKTTGGPVCTVESKDECQQGQRSSEPGGFEYLSGVAVDPATGNVYVADNVNNRIQEFTSTGRFISMFGWDVNGTKDKEPVAGQYERNLCTKREVIEFDVKCQAGAVGTGSGQFSGLTSVTVDPTSEAVYTQEVAIHNFRVDKYSPGDRFVWMIGRKVNATTKTNICDETEIVKTNVKCGEGEEGGSHDNEHGSFKFGSFYGDLLAAGGPEDLLYVGDEHRVQEFEADGRWKREIKLTQISLQAESRVAALAVNPGGEVYIAYYIPNRSNQRNNHTEIVRKFDSSGREVLQIPIKPAQRSATVEINGLAVDGAGHLAVIGVEIGTNPLAHFGLIYNDVTGTRISEFAAPSDNDGIAFGDDGDLYIAATDRQAVWLYTPVPIAVLVTSPVVCGPESKDNIFTLFDCALNGEANPYGSQQLGLRLE